MLIHESGIFLNFFGAHLHCSCITGSILIRHADLLSKIAQKEAKVNELRQGKYEGRTKSFQPHNLRSLPANLQNSLIHHILHQPELSHHETELNSLKTRWTSLITRSSPNTTNPSAFPPPSSHLPSSSSSSFNPSCTITSNGNGSGNNNGHSNNLAPAPANSSRLKLDRSNSTSSTTSSQSRSSSLHSSSDNGRLTPTNPLPILSIPTTFSTLPAFATDLVNSAVIVATSEGTNGIAYASAQAQNAVEGGRRVWGHMLGALNGVTMGGETSGGAVGSRSVNGKVGDQGENGEIKNHERVDSGRVGELPSSKGIWKGLDMDSSTPSRLGEAFKPLSPFRGHQPTFSLSSTSSSTSSSSTSASASLRSGSLNRPPPIIASRHIKTLSLVSESRERALDDAISEDLVPGTPRGMRPGEDSKGRVKLEEMGFVSLSPTRTVGKERERERRGSSMEGKSRLGGNEGEAGDNGIKVTNSNDWDEWPEDG